MADLDFITQQVRDEIRVDVSGKGTASISGVARLCGVAQQTLSTAYSTATSKIFKILAEHGFDPYSFAENGVPDIAVALTISYYANKAGKRCTQEARLVNDALLAVGIRVWMQEVSGWENPATRKLTPEEVAEICLLPTGRGWDKRFEDDYYMELSKLTNLQQFGASRPKLWGALTDEWVYKMLPPGVRDGVRASREKHGNWNKLHQFLSDDGIEVFRTHMNTLMTTMRSHDTVNEVRKALRTLTRSQYQYKLFSDCRKDGKLTIPPQLNVFDRSEDEDQAS